MRNQVLFVAAFLPILACAGDFSYREAKATVVAVDPVASTVLVKWADGSMVRSRVEGNAVIKLGNLKAGDRIMVTCQQNDRGQHLAITAIKIKSKPAENVTSS